MNRYQITGNRFFSLFFVTCYLLSVICSCDYGQLGDAGKTDTYSSGSEVFEEHLGFFSATWNSGYDIYRIRKWSDITDDDKLKAQEFFPSLNINNPITYSTKDMPKNSDYFLLYDDGNHERGFCFMGLVQSINIFNNDIKRGAIIIEYFEGADPAWLSDPDGYTPQNLAPGEKPFFGIYFNMIDTNTVQFANPVDIAAMNNGRPYHTEQKTMQDAINFFGAVNEAEFISWGVVMPHNREKQNNEKQK